MREIHYYVATSINGFIESQKSQTNLFLNEGDHVNEYFKDLEEYSDVLLGRKTYEYGFEFGLIAGKKAYPWMDHYLISDDPNLKYFEQEITIVRSFEVKSTIQKLRKMETNKNIYLCGGGNLAGLLWQLDEIDRLFLKVNPIILSNGIHLFEQIDTETKLEFVKLKQFESGVILLEYQRKRLDFT